MRIQLIIIIGLTLFVWSCKDQSPKETEIETIAIRQKTNADIEKIKVLNFGTFHMGRTTDANTAEFDEHDKENQLKVHDIVKKIALFKPTVILVETAPEYDEKLQARYKEYIENPNIFYENPYELNFSLLN